MAVAAPDPVMAAIAPIGLAASVGTALIVDMAARDAGRTLADLADEGPLLEEISPGRAGVAVIAAGSTRGPDLVSIIDRVASRWPAMVIRDPDSHWPGPTVPVHVLYPHAVRTWEEGAAVWQSLGAGQTPPGPGPLLPPISSRTMRHLLRGWVPRPNRWLRAWRQVWEMPWA